MNTFDSTVDKTTRKQSEKKTGQYREIELDIPTIYSAYNMGNVGTDRMDPGMDQVVVSYYRNYTRFCWSVKVMTYITGMCVMNAYITYMDVSKKDKETMTYLDLILAVCDELAPPTPTLHYHTFPGHTHTPEVQGRPKPTTGTVPKPMTQKKENDRPTRKHFPFCHNMCSLRCIECDVHVCTNTVVSHKRCWTLWYARPPLRIIN